MVKKARFITGKGGVGKSCVAAALAYQQSLLKKPILLAELSESSFYQDYFGLEKITYSPKTFFPFLDICHWSPDDCLKEYALHLLKIESLYKLFMENPVSKSLIQIAPGLHELALLGKITSSPRRHGPEMQYEEIVIDAYSTGHFLSLLRAPSAMSEAIQFGPMGEQSKSIDSWIRNKNFTEVSIVTLAEELPITETLELSQCLKTEFQIEPLIYLNKMSGLTFDEIANLDVSTQTNLTSLLKNEEWARSELQKSGFRYQELPLVTSLNSLEILKQIGEIIHV